MLFPSSPFELRPSGYDPTRRQDKTQGRQDFAILSSGVMLEDRA
jgi:hypothetical protein